MLCGFGIKGGDWELVWSPSVYEIYPYSQKADNTGFFVYSAKEKTYIIAIAGTNPIALLDWIEEDFAVGKNLNIDWAKFSKGSEQPTKENVVVADKHTERISLGTTKGVWALWNDLEQSNYAPPANASYTLAEYLAQLNSQPTTNRSTLVVTGHSLGGALAPTLARWAKRNLHFAAVYTLPTAGPTPGNFQYQTTWDEIFESTPTDSDINLGNKIKTWNCNVMNL
ncbi:MAG: hypothetical protein AAGG51_20655 [Cyanobacteria bacterium P01_G01_bin.54]